MEEREEYAEYAVKTNIIESNCGLDEIPKKFLGYSIEIRSTVDKYLYVLIVRSNNKNFTLYLDTINKRFWKIHNIEKSETVDAFLNQFSNQLHKIDTLWMPHQMLETLEEDYINVGFSIKYKQEILEEDDLSDEEVSQLSMRLWSKGSKPSKGIIHLLETNGYPTTKTSTRLLNICDDELRFLDEAYYDGKITVIKGTDIEEHIHFVNDVILTYSDIMNRIERNRMCLVSSANEFEIIGAPFEFEFSKEQDIEKLAEKLTNSTKPFRTWGVVHDVENDFLRIAGVDTHTGDKFDMDLMPDYARIYLPKDACGNLIFRLYTNIQHSLDPRVKIFDESGTIF